MRYHEQLSIILMRDNGPRRSFRIRASRFFLLLIFFASMPLLCAFLAWQCQRLWQENADLRANMQRFEMDCQTAQATAERLQNFEELLREEGVPGRELLLRRLARARSDVQETAPEPAQATAPVLADGPGHEEFPVIDTGRIKVGNVQARALRGNALRIGLDLRNAESPRLITGSVSATLVTASGQKFQLAFDPEDVGNFRISRFKRAVMVARVPERYSLVNAQVILEVTEQDEGLIYRNIFAVER